MTPALRLCYERSVTGGDELRIGIALSGGGSRAIAFHLGCLRTLHRLGVLDRAKVLSTVSGGSVIGALYALHEGPFETFERQVRALLRAGLLGAALITAVTSLEGLKAFASAGRLLVWSVLSAPLRLWRRLGPVRPPLRAPRRFASRTTILGRAIDRRLFHGATLADTRRPDRPKWIALAAELRTGTAFYFSAGFAGTWRLGRADPTGMQVAHAVAASAAYPLFLPALDETLCFTPPGGAPRTERVSLTDGGVYDNLGLAPFWPDRDPRISLDVEPVDLIIACRAGDGPREAEPSISFAARMFATVATMHDRAQNATMKRLFDLQESGRIKGFLLPYLGQDDRKLKAAPEGLVGRDEVINYPTNFSPMPAAWIDRLVLRGEQVTLAVIGEHAPYLLGDNSDRSRA